MKTLIHLRKRWLKNSPGFTLVELVVAMAVGSFVVAGVLAVWTQLFSVTATNSNYMAAFRQVQSGGDWISRDALMTQAVYDMASTVLVGDISDAADEITVDSTDGFPPSGIISIEGDTTDGIADELIQYTGVDYDTNKFTGCIRGGHAAGHDAGKSVTVFVGLNWTAWSGDRHQVVYNLKETSRQLVRTHLKHLATEPDPDVWVLESSNIADAIVFNRTTSEWHPDERELTVVITADVSGYVVGRHGIQSQMATRTYGINPRPFF